MEEQPKKRRGRKKKIDLDLTLDTKNVDITLSRENDTTKLSVDTPILDIELEKKKGEKLKADIKVDEKALAAFNKLFPGINKKK